MTGIVKNSIMSDEEVKKKIMNEGYPLQRFCGKKLQSLGWNVHEEYPVEQLVPVGKNPYSLPHEGKKIRTSGDLSAKYVNTAKQYAICVCISCKRQHKINWSFMQAMFTENVHHLIRLRKDEDYVRDYVFSLEDRLDDTYPLCNIPTNLFQREDLPREEDKIVQTSENLYLETLQTIENDYDWLGGQAPYRQIFYVPVIVTAAKIHAYDVDETKFEIDKTDSIDIKEVNYLMYQHHLPRSMHRYLEIAETGNVSTLEKFNLFVVNYQHFEDFIKSLMKKFEVHPM